MIDFSGQSTGRYQIIEKLGTGGMAIVYKAYDTNLDIDVAIKFIRTERLIPEFADKARKRFKNEAQKTAKLMHANIVSVIDYGEYKDVPFLVMRYISGGKTLKSLIGKPMPWKQAAELIIPISQALEFAHVNHIIHRDVKPSNILMTDDGTPLLSDFGIARVVEEDSGGDALTTTGMAIGTPEYMAPEQWQGGKVDSRADIYALGVVLYELLTGRPPYKADTVPATMVQVMHDPLPRIDRAALGIPEKMEKFLYKALARDPENRFSSMNDFSSVLLNILSSDQKELSLQSLNRNKLITSMHDQLPNIKGEKKKDIFRKWWWAACLFVGIIIVVFLLLNKGAIFYTKISPALQNPAKSPVPPTTLPTKVVNSASPTPTKNYVSAATMIPNDGTFLGIGQWNKATSLPIPLASGFTSAVFRGQHLFFYHNKIYVFGGISLNETRSTKVYTATINNDGSISEWTESTPIPKAYSDYDVVIYEDVVYLVTGASGAIDVIYSKLLDDGSLTEWENTTSLKPSRHNFSVLASNGCIYSIGGNDGGTVSYVKYSHIAGDGTLGFWSSTTPLPESVEGHNSFSNDEFLYVIAPNHSIFVGQVESDCSISEWEKTTSAPLTSKMYSSFVNDGLVYIIGESSAYYAKILPDGNIDEWQMTTKLPISLQGTRVGAYNGYVYSVGGVINQHYSDNVYFAKIENPE